ncbi:exported hypothetical protein [Rhodococcus sp. RD6.2]|uniref:hypothetical protein n=1 Tax=Rhodococcus sp. RD6.2 TaxID=260936 RepID=UPI00063B9784|nr:hypothetical protein [Rhodococcus sp. RD6.2]CRK52366.1 exported hypothetical protein [Rhodococcus sp. RD6.2]
MRTVSRRTPSLASQSLRLVWTGAFALLLAVPAAATAATGGTSEPSVATSLQLRTSEAAVGEHVDLTATCAEGVDGHMSAVDVNGVTVSLTNPIASGRHRFDSGFTVPDITGGVHPVTTTCGGTAFLTVLGEIPDPVLTLAPKSGPPGTTISLYATELPTCAEPWYVLVDGQQMTTAEQSGSTLATELAVPDDADAGEHAVQLECPEPSVLVESTFTVTGTGADPVLSLDPRQGRRDTPVSLSATGLPRCAESWNVLFDGQAIATAEQSGPNLAAELTVPNDADTGQRTVLLECPEPGAEVEASFTVLAAGGNGGGNGNNGGNNSGGNGNNGGGSGNNSSSGGGGNNSGSSGENNSAQEQGTGSPIMLVTAAAVAAAAIAGALLLNRKRQARNRMDGHIDVEPLMPPPSITVDPPAGDGGAHSIQLDARTDTGYRTSEVEHHDDERNDDS